MTPLRETIKKVFSNVPGLKKQMVMSPSETFKLGIKYDLLIVDEAHRLRQYRNISWRGEFKKKNQLLGLSDEGTELDWILANSLNQIFFYDAAQSVKPSDIHEYKFTELLNSPNTLKLSLKSQMRTKGGNDYITFIDKLLNCEVIRKPNFSKEFELEYFDTFKPLYNKLKIKEEEYGLCRMIAGYSWEWKSDPKRKENLDLNAIDIRIDGMQFQWNKTYNDWITSEDSFEQIGCIHTTQGYDLNYVAIIFGLEIDYDPIQNEIVIDKTKYFDKYGKNGVTDINDLKSYIVNIYKTVLYRGIKGVYIYACNNNLKQYLRKHLNISQDINFINEAKSNKPRIIPFESVQPFVNAVPIYDIKVAATNFTDPQFYEEFSWAELPMQVTPKRGYFIAQVIGESMNKKIPNGSYCLFSQDEGGSREGKIVLVESTKIEDSDFGSGYTVKVYHSVKQIGEDQWSHKSITLKPLSNNPDFKDIELIEDELNQLKVVGIFERVLA